MMKHERAIWVICVLSLAAVGIGQTSRLGALRDEIIKLQKAAAWPDRPSFVEVTPVGDAAFKPTTQTVIPQDFWGEFAEDVHECGREGSMLIAAKAITEGEDVTTVAKIKWAQRGRLEVDGLDKSYLSVAFRMEMSQDRAEIAFVHTNQKRIVQRCSMRAHAAPEPLKSAAEDYRDVAAEVTIDDEVMADANMALEVEGE